MNNSIIPALKNIDVILYINNIAIGGQKGVNLMRKTELVNITNKIDINWSEYASTVKSWSITCGGIIIKNSQAFEYLESAFYSGTPIDVKFIDGDKNYTGKAFITSFPINTSFDNTCSYSIGLTGTGELTNE